MGTYVTPEGYISPTFEENKLYWENVYNAIFGDTVDLDPTGPVGQLVATAAKRDTDLFEMAGEIYTSRDPDQAIGVALDSIASEIGLIRISASATTISNVLLYGTDGTLVVTGKQANQTTGDNTDITYSLTGDVSISKSFARDLSLEIGTPSTSEVFTINLDSIPYSHVTTIGQSATDVADALVVLITAGAYTGTASNDGAVISIQQFNLDFVATFTSNITITLLASSGFFQCDTTGVFSVPTNTLDGIATPVAGWDSVINPNVGTTGREQETDAELRLRMETTVTTGNATDDAIVTYISNNVSGITRVAIQSNRSDEIDGEGRPPHSFQVVVSGGLDQDIGDAIWVTQPSGIASFGAESVIVQDSNGIDQEVFFDRPTPIYIHVKVKRDKYSEETYPTTGDADIKQSIVDWSVVNQPIGKDVIRQRLSTPVYEVPGIEDIDITIDGTANPGDTPTYASTNIVIAVKEEALFDVTRIVVEDLTP